MEFLAVIVNTWFSIKILLTRNTSPGDWILKFLYDTNGALGWMAHESRTPTIQNITFAYATMITFHAPSIFIIIAKHTTGLQNDGVNALSASLVSPELSPLMAYWIPVGMLLYLHFLVSISQTGDLLKSATTALPFLLS